MLQLPAGSILELPQVRFRSWRACKAGERLVSGLVEALVDVGRKGSGLKGCSWLVGCGLRRECRGRG